MRLPPHLLDSPYFVFSQVDELIAALGSSLREGEATEIKRLGELGLPPVTSRDALAVMLGVNPGIVWSLENRTSRYYRKFSIPKGSGIRIIQAPKIALKIIQKWISVHLQRKYSPPDHVFGFVPGRSHVLAASVHCNARWVYSIDIKDFFQSTPIEKVRGAFFNIGYGEDSAQILARLCCLNGCLSQGAPTSPVISNIAFSHLDVMLSDVAEYHGVRMTRYADDIVFSGAGAFEDGVRGSVERIFSGEPWKISSSKTKVSFLPNRLKVHGLLVNGESVRLTKGYRNKIRAFKHIIERESVKSEDLKKISGHIRYAEYVDRIGGQQ